MTLRVERFVESDAEAWDRLCATALQSPFLLTRRFLAYHQDRFQDVSYLVYDDSVLAGVFPAAVDRLDSRHVVSHPGVTFGGIVHAGRLTGSRMIEALQHIWDAIRVEGFTKLTYKVVPHIYCRGTAQDDLYALFKLGATRVRCDLSCSIDLDHRLPVSSRRQRGRKKALNAGLQVRHDNALLPEFWTVLETVLQGRHAAKPVHSLSEIVHLANAFPEEIKLVSACRSERVLAGVLLFQTEMTHHAQYIAGSEEGASLGALDLIFASCIDDAAQTGARWFDFGISNQDAGRYLNQGLFQYKVEFGGCGTVHEFYVLEV